MKKCGLISLFLLVVLMGINIFVYYSLKWEEYQRDRLHYALDAEIDRYDNGDAPCVDISLATNFSWDQLFIFNPYSTSSEIEATIGTFWLDSRFTQISTDENITLLVFTRKGHVVQYLRFPRGEGDFSRAEIGAGYGVEQACFIRDERGLLVAANNP